MVNQEFGLGHGQMTSSNEEFDNQILRSDVLPQSRRELAIELERKIRVRLKQASFIMPGSATSKHLN